MYNIIASATQFTVQCKTFLLPPHGDTYKGISKLRIKQST